MKTKDISYTQHGGGGHKGAAGFITKEPVWYKKLLKLRKKAIANGKQLMGWKELRKELRRRRIGGRS